jgi:aryl-alcohol dehydrogenase-like predicted oxidoreductase
MQYRPKAQLGLGLAALGRPGYITLGHAGDLEGDYAVASMEKRCHAVLDAAWAAGIHWFDAARSYGRAEEFLSHWLHSRNVAPGEVTVSSKWGYTYTADWHVAAQHHEVKDHSLPALERQFAESRALLYPFLGVYEVHSATLESGVLEDTRVLERLGELRDQGLTVGLTLSGPKQGETLERALEVRVRGKPLWSAVQATWNLLERSAEPALRRAKDAGLRVLVKEALANGRLTERGAPQLLRREAARYGVGPDAVALAIALAQPFVDVVLCGAATPPQLASNLRARELVAVDDKVLAPLGESAEHYWAERAKLPWN